MNRRRFLAGIGGVASLPLLVGLTRTDERPVRIRYWTSEGAARWVDHSHLQGFVRAALDPAFSAVDVSFAGVVPVGTEHGYDVMDSGEWPLRAWASNNPGIGRVADANILVTDGPLGPDPPGYARHRYAAIGGARHLESLPAPDDVPEVVEYEPSLYTMQLFLHELGHTLGLSHDHGTVESTEDGRVASPMVSGYAWSPGSKRFDATESACGTPYPEDDPEKRYLSMRYSPCATAELTSSRLWLLD